MLVTILLAAAVATDDSARFQRYERWAKEGRIDLCAEAIIQCRDDRQAERMADLLLPLRKWPFAQPQIPRGPKIEIKHIGPVFERRRGEPETTRRYKGESVFVPFWDGGDGHRNVLVRADKCTVQEINRGGWFVAVRDNVTEKFRVGLEDFHGEWWFSVVIVGNSASVPRVNRSFIVCDGDLKLTAYETSESVIIANGNIDCPCSVHKTKFYAAGKVTIPKNRTNTGEVHEDGKDMPVKFLDLGRDLGLRVTDKLALEGDWRGLRKGDTITRVGGAAVDSVPSLRKQLRSDVVRGGGRGGPPRERVRHPHRRARPQPHTRPAAQRGEEVGSRQRSAPNADHAHDVSICIVSGWGGTEWRSLATFDGLQGFPGDGPRSPTGDLWRP